MWVNVQSGDFGPKLRNFEKTVKLKSPESPVHSGDFGYTLPPSPAQYPKSLECSGHSVDFSFTVFRNSGILGQNPQIAHLPKFTPDHFQNPQNAHKWAIFYERLIAIHCSSYV